MALQIITRAFAERDAAEHAAHGKRSALAERLENSVGVGIQFEWKCHSEAVRPIPRRLQSAVRRCRIVNSIWPLGSCRQFSTIGV
jgi:hypothetical protein